MALFDDAASANITTASPRYLQDLNKVLFYILPTVSGLIVPLSLVNILLLLNHGVRTSPSALIYFVMILMDILNALTGFLITADPEADHWRGVESNIYLFTFDATIVLIFGLALIRYLCIRMSALGVLSNLRYLAYGATGVSLLFGGFAVGYPHLLPSRSFVNFAWLDLFECLVIVCTVTLSSYTWVAIRASKSHINTTIYKSASTTSLLITLNFITSYTYYVYLNSARMYYTLHNAGCPPNSWIMVFVCKDSLYVGVTFMCAQSLVNNLILLGQRHTRRLLVCYVKMCVSDVRRKCGRSRSGYRYFEDY